MIKKLSFAAAVLISILTFSLNVSARGSYLCELYDYADELYEDEIENIERRLEKTSEKTGLNLCVVVNNSIEGGEYTYQDYADVFYEENFGINTDGICLFIRFDPNYVHFSTSGKGQDYYNSHTDSILDGMVSDLRSHDIEGAVDNMCDDLEHYYRVDNLKWLFFSLAGLIVGIGIGIAVLFIVRSRYRKYAASGTVRYIDKSQTNFTERSDVFIRQYTSKVRISSDISSSGGGSSHTSSGGGSHGGGGRSF